MKKFEWIRISENYDCYVDIMYLGHFCLIKNTIWDNEKEVSISSTMIKIDMCSLDENLYKILSKKTTIKEIKNV